MEQSRTIQPTASLLSVRGIKAFSLNAVLKGIDLDVGSGDVVALIGGNGANQSTLMVLWGFTSRTAAGCMSPARRTG